MTAALLASVMATDLRVCDLVRRWRPSTPVRLLTVGATKFGDGWGWAACAALLHGWGVAPARTLAAGSLAAAAASALFMVLKQCFRRPRPCHEGPHPVFRVTPRDEFSFPSGHTMNAFSLATVLSASCPAAAPVLFPIAAAVGASRVALGVHYPSDVVAGALLGTMVGAGGWLLLS